MPAEERSSRSKMSRRSIANVDGHEPRKEVGMCCQCTHGAIAQLGLIVEQQKQTAHQPGTTGETPMRGLIIAQISRFNGIR